MWDCDVLALTIGQLCYGATSFFKQAITVVAYLLLAPLLLVGSLSFALGLQVGKRSSWDVLIQQYQ